MIYLQYMCLVGKISYYFLDSSVDKDQTQRLCNSAFFTTIIQMRD